MNKTFRESKTAKMKEFPGKTPALRYIRQPDGSSLCGQACVAMLIGIGMAKVVLSTGKTRGTNLKDLLPLLKTKYHINQARLQRVTNNHWLPDLALLKVTWHKGSHWVIKNSEMIYDPGSGIIGLDEYKDYIAHRGRITSFLSLKIKNVV